MSVRARQTSSKQTLDSDVAPSITTSTPSTSAGDDDDMVLPQTPKSKPPRRSQSLSNRVFSQTLTNTANLANLLPTGTLLAFQILTPIFTNNGNCDSATRPMTLILLALLAASCFLACLTDSFRALDGKVYYGFATFRGLLLFDYEAFEAASGGSGHLPDLSKHRLEFIDLVHGVLSVLVFLAVALRDRNTDQCFYPKPDQETQEVLDIVPAGVGLICSLLFVAFPTRRHGIGTPGTTGNVI